MTAEPFALWAKILSRRQAVIEGRMLPALRVRRRSTDWGRLRVAFVLHDIFDLPFEEVGNLIDRSPVAVRQLASRAGRRVRGAMEPAQKDLALHHALTEAFLAAAKSGDMRTLLALLDPEVVLTSDDQAARMGAGPTVRGSEQVARFFSKRADTATVATINGDAAIIVAAGRRLAPTTRMRPVSVA